MPEETKTRAGRARLACEVSCTSGQQQEPTCLATGILGLQPGEVVKELDGDTAVLRMDDRLGFSVVVGTPTTVWRGDLNTARLARSRGVITEVAGGIARMIILYHQIEPGWDPEMPLMQLGSLVYEAMPNSFLPSPPVAQGRAVR